MRFQEKKSSPASEGIARAGELVKKKPTGVAGIQDFAKGELEKKRKEEEEAKKKKKGQIDAAPSKGILSRIYDSVMGSSEKK